MGDVKPGDRVKVEFEGTAKDYGSKNTAYVKGPGGVLYFVPLDALTVIEDPIPTKPGLYRDRIGDLWIREPFDGRFVPLTVDEGDRAAGPTSRDLFEAEAEKWAPFVPVRGESDPEPGCCLRVEVE